MNEVISMPNVGKQNTRRVELYNASSSAVTFRKGTGVCYDRDYVTTVAGQTATDNWAGRDFRVLPPDSTNYLNFAGTLVETVTVPAGTAKAVDIYMPGGLAEIAVGAATTIDSTILTASVTVGEAGRFSRAGRIGRGTALCLQTKAVDGASASGVKATNTATIDYDNIVVKAITSSVSCGAGDKTLTLTDFFLRAVVGDKVVILGGAAADGTTQATAGVYTIVTRTSKDVAVLDSSPAAAVALCTAYIYRGQPTVLAYLYDGEESGLQQTVAPDTSGSAMVPDCLFGGTNYVVCGGITCSTGTTVTVPNATAGMKRFTMIYDGTITTAGAIITPTASNIVGFKVGGTYGQRVALVTIVPAVASGSCVLEWNGSVWDWVGGLGVST